MFDDINDFLHIALRSASIVDTFDVIHDDKLLNYLGLGIRAYSRYMRQGVKAVINLQAENTRLKDRIEWLETELEEYESEEIADEE